MTKGFFAALKASAQRLGQKGKKTPAVEPIKESNHIQFKTVEPGGVGPSMVLLHGLFGALSNWDSVLPLFQKYSTPVALQFPLLTGGRADIKVGALADFTEQFVSERKLAPAILCGNSLGGHVAMRLYLKNPEMVDCMILSATSGLYEHTVSTLPVRPDERFVREHMARVFYHQKFVTEEAIAEITEILKSRQNTLNLILAAKSAKRDNLLHLLKTIKVPTLLLWGEEDLVTPMDVAETFHKNIPNSKLVTVKGCGHAPMIEHPEWFSNEVEKFLKEHSKLYRKNG